MSTTTPRDDTAEQPPSLSEALAVWTEQTPDPHATNEVVAAWFDLKVELLAPITSNPDHPEHDRARHFAAKAVQSANALRDKENER